MSLITSGVMQGLIEASSHSKYSEDAMRVYHQAANDKDIEKMKRALGYASDEMDKAFKSSDEAGEALKAAQAQATTEKNAGQQAELEKNIQANNMEGNTTAQHSVKDKPEEAPSTTGDTAQNAAGNEKAGSSQKTESKIYTSQGEAKSFSAPPHVTLEV